MNMRLSWNHLMNSHKQNNRDFHQTQSFLPIFSYTSTSAPKKNPWKLITSNFQGTGLHQGIEEQGGFRVIRWWAPPWVRAGDTDGNPKIHHRLDVSQTLVNNGISTTNLNWWVYRISNEPSTECFQRKQQETHIGISGIRAIIQFRERFGTFETVP